MRLSSPGLLLLTLGIVLGAPLAGQPPAWAETAAAATPPLPGAGDYADPKAWLCRPGRTDSCAVDQTATVVEADGSQKLETFKPDPKAPIDCFYLYPTASDDLTGNSDMNPGPGELGVTGLQLARFGGVCRLFAPIYRSVTLAAVMGGAPTTPPDPNLAYESARAAWRQYLEHDNQGRGFVLIGHSQGAGVLARLIREEIDAKPVGRRMVSALLMGTPSALAGPDYKTIPACSRLGQIHCVIRYSSFRSGAQPSPASPFGHTGAGLPSVACVNPAALGGGSGVLKPYLLSFAMQGPAPVWVRQGAAPRTIYVSPPGMLTAQCVSMGKTQVLAVSVHAHPSDRRAQDIVGDMIIGGHVNPDWGLHGIDVNLAQGNLIDDVAAASKTYRRGR